MAKKLQVKPLNLTKDNCTAMSSNCVVWQGPNIPCLDICKGASITEVMYQVATSFCEMFEQLNPEEYDIECLDIEQCENIEFKDIIQKLITKSCLTTQGCNIIVDIVRTENVDYQAVVTGGTAPYTYQWSVLTSVFEDTAPTLTNATTQIVSLTPTSPTNLKVVVTDANGCKANTVINIFNPVG
jgi:hypothetical protein